MRHPRSGDRRDLARRSVPYALACAVLWWVLTTGETASWILGAPVVVLSALAAAVLAPPARVRISLSGIAAFLPFFLWRSLAGGLDVARRALGWRLAIQPDLVTYRLRLLPDEGPARVVFLNILSLLPGTLAADIAGDAVQLHVLTAPAPIDDLERLEAHVARIFRHPVRADDPPEAPHG
jgi:multicomponent Na+:H+ antiporter subunit E